MTLKRLNLTIMQIEKYQIHTMTVESSFSCSHLNFSYLFSFFDVRIRVRAAIADIIPLVLFYARTFRKCSCLLENVWWIWWWVFIGALRNRWSGEELEEKTTVMRIRDQQQQAWNCRSFLYYFAIFSDNLNLSCASEHCGWKTAGFAGSFVVFQKKIVLHSHL